MWSKYNIDAMKNSDGSYRHNSREIFNLIKGAVHCGHTAHLETGLGVVAFRPYEKNGKRWRLDFYGPYQDDIVNRDSENADFGSAEMLDLYRWAYKHLNGTIDTTYKANDTLDVQSNQAVREGYVLAVIGDEVLLEYEMPGKTSKYANHPAQPTSSLRLVRTIGSEIVGDYKSVSYNTVPKRWLDAIKAAGMTNWIGMGQRSANRIPFPQEAT